MHLRPERTPRELWRQSKPQDGDSARVRAQRIEVREDLLRARAFGAVTGALGWFAIAIGIGDGSHAAEGVIAPAVVFSAATVFAMCGAYETAQGLPHGISAETPVDEASYDAPQPNVQDKIPEHVEPYEWPSQPPQPPTSN